VASNAAVPTRVFWYSAPTGATHRFFINGSTCLDIGCNTDNVYRCTIAYPTVINSSLNCSGDIVNTYWRLRNDSD